MPDAGGHRHPGQHREGSAAECQAGAEHQVVKDECVLLPRVGVADVVVDQPSPQSSVNQICRDASQFSGPDKVREDEPHQR